MTTRLLFLEILIVGVFVGATSSPVQAISNPVVSIERDSANRNASVLVDPV